MIGGAGKPFVDTFHEVVFFSQSMEGGVSAKVKVTEKKRKGKEDVRSD